MKLSYATTFIATVNQDDAARCPDNQTLSIKHEGGLSTTNFTSSDRMMQVALAIMNAVHPPNPPLDTSGEESINDAVGALDLDDGVETDDRGTDDDDSSFAPSEAPVEPESPAAAYVGDGFTQETTLPLGEDGNPNLGF